MGVSKNTGTPKSSILIGFSIINHPFWGTPVFGNTHISQKPLSWVEVDQKRPVVQVDQVDTESHRAGRACWHNPEPLPGAMGCQEIRIRMVGMNRKCTHGVN